MLAVLLAWGWPILAVLCPAGVAIWLLSEERLVPVAVLEALATLALLPTEPEEWDGDMPPSSLETSLLVLCCDKDAADSDLDMSSLPFFPFPLPGTGCTCTSFCLDGNGERQALLLKLVAAVRDRNTSSVKLDLDSEASEPSPVLSTITFQSELKFSFLKLLSLSCTDVPIDSSDSIVQFVFTMVQSVPVSVVDSE
eukprot:g11351.t1